MEGKLNTLILGDKNENRRGGWLYAYLINYITDEKERDRRWPEWQAAIGNIGPRLWELIGARLDAALKEAGVGPGARLVWLPTSALGILPLGLAQDPASKRRLGDDYEIVYAPSLEALTAAQRQIAKPAPTTLAAVVNPTGGIKGWDLPGAAYEGKLVASHFPGKARTVLVGPAAKPDAVLAALKDKSYWHFATHGAFSWEDARQSGLYLSERKLLSVGTLLQADGLGRPRLVVLSACETGLYDISRNPDEFIGLPGTFTALGAAGVLGTLWPVADTATALLIAKFYELHLGRHVAPPTALRRAQLWLRQASNVELDRLCQGRRQPGAARQEPRGGDRRGAERDWAQALAQGSAGRVGYGRAATRRRERAPRRQENGPRRSPRCQALHPSLLLGRVHLYRAVTVALAHHLRGEHACRLSAYGTPR